MSDYVCKYGLYHDKKCNRFDNKKHPSSNNGWIYTAYADLLNLPVNLEVSLDQCYEGFIPLKLNRLPNKLTPPMSRDEVIGMFLLDFISLQDLYVNNWRFHRSDLKVPLWRQLKAVWSLKGKHRNYVWKEKIYDAYPIVFNLAPHDRYFIKELSFVKGSLFEKIMFNLYVYQTAKSDNISAKNICWLQLKHLGDKRADTLFDQKKNFLEYFGKKHIFNNL